MKFQFKPLCIIFTAFLLWFSANAEDQPEMPLPIPNIPENPPFPPSVVTAGGQRLLLEDVDVAVQYEPKKNQLVCNHPGSWLINFPLTKIAGFEKKSPDEISQILFGRPSTEIRNWYLRTPGTSTNEPPSPSGPAPIKPNADPTIVVNGNHPQASDENPGTIEKPLETISAATAKARAGDVVAIYPGLYRESLISQAPGSAENPIVFEGIRGADGELPILSGNDPAPDGAWIPVAGHDGLWRAEAWIDGPAPLTLNGKTLDEQSLPTSLRPNEFTHNYASIDLAFPQLSARLEKHPEIAQKQLEADAEGYVDFGNERGVFYIETWLWMPPNKDRKEVWDSRFPEPLTGEVSLGGGFRAGRQSSGSYGTQLNPYRLILNGKPMPNNGGAGEPTPHTDYGQSGDKWQRLPLREGWNRIELIIDSSHRGDSKPHHLKFDLPKGTPATVSAANEPKDKNRPVENGREETYITEWSVVGPFPPKDKERAVYLRLPEGVNPNDQNIDMGSRKQILQLDHPFWTVRGLEFCHGRQFQQRAMAVVAAPGVTVEHCRFLEPEVRCLSIALSKWDQSDPPAIIRGNWMESPGALGMGASGNTKLLTPENQDNLIPGRGRMLVEYNTIINNNRMGYRRFWESGAMKFFRLTGCVIRNNNFFGGDGPGLWLDWEHYNNRLEGNYFKGVMAFGIGIEASPGPNLMANNVCVDIEHGGAWFKYGLLGWSSARLWAVSNTLDTAWGMYFAEGGDNRGTAWKALPERNATLLNNLAIGKPAALHRGRIGWAAGNRLYGPEKSGLQQYSRWPNEDIKQQVEPGSQLGGESGWPNFLHPEIGDYRFSSGHHDASAGIARWTTETQGQKVDLTSLVRHDFYGLLRFPEDGIPAGAFRVKKETDNGQLEVEFTDGTIRRIGM